MSITKSKIREERGFLKKANDCSNCISFSKLTHNNPGVCAIDTLQVAKSSWCKSHKKKENK